ncbi:hypothetical protein BVX98_00030, partial [bacterium F11]
NGRDSFGNLVPTGIYFIEVDGYGTRYEVEITVINTPANQVALFDAQNSLGKFFNKVKSPDLPMLIAYNVSSADSVNLNVYDLLGQQVRSLNAPSNVGDHTVEWDGKNDDGKDVASDVYLVVLKVGNNISKRKVAILR